MRVETGRHFPLFDATLRDFLHVHAQINGGNLFHPWLEVNVPEIGPEAFLFLQLLVFPSQLASANGLEPNCVFTALIFKQADVSELFVCQHMGQYKEKTLQKRPSELVGH